MKALILYKDWLLLTRGKIRPEVGDIIWDRYLDEKLSLDKTKVNTLNNPNNKYMIRNYYVEIDYNPNEAIEFANWLETNTSHQQESSYVYNSEWKPTEELYQYFKEY